MAEFGYVEINGSNTMTLDTSGIVQATRVFVGPWPARFQFARLVGKKPHPDAGWAYPVKIDIKPLLGDAEQSVALPSSIVSRAIQYRSAMITVDYGVREAELAWWPPGLTVPARRRGTFLELRADAGGEFLTIDNAQWGDNLDEDPFKPVPDGESPAFRLYMPQTQFDIVWHRVERVPVRRLDALVGRVNEYEFLGKPPETVLLNNYSFSIETDLDLSMPVKWAVSFSFTYRGVKSKDKVYGWNHELRKEGGWIEVYVKTDTGWAKRYEAADFTDMFT